jgi:hypothetical protein
MARILQESNNFERKRIFTLKTLMLLGTLFLCSCALEPEEDADPGEPLPSLLGTRWVFATWGDQRLYFISGDTVEYTLNDPADPAQNETIMYHYEYNGNRKTGEIEKRGAFSLSRDNKTLHFPSYYIFGHGVDFIRLNE